MHALAQWWRLVEAEDPHSAKNSLWKEGEPALGEICREMMDVLVDPLERHTDSSDECYIAFWVGRTWFLPSQEDESTSSNPTDFVPFSGRDLSAPRLQLPEREYALLQGSLGSVFEGPAPTRFSGYVSPNLLWPSDRAWFLASEIDLDSTLLGGSEELIHEIVSATELEAWQVQPEDSLSFDADRINA